MLGRALHRRPRDTANALHVVERRHRDGSWLPVALAVRAKNGAEAVHAYRSCLPRALWRALRLRARLQTRGEFAGAVRGSLAPE